MMKSLLFAVLTLTSCVANLPRVYSCFVCHLKHWSFLFFDLLWLIVSNYNRIVSIFPGYWTFIHLQLAALQVWDINSLVILFVSGFEHDLLLRTVAFNDIGVFRIRQISNPPFESISWIFSYTDWLVWACWEEIALRIKLFSIITNLILPVYGPEVFRPLPFSQQNLICVLIKFLN